MMKASIGSILLAFLAFGYVSSAAPEMPLGRNLEQYLDDTPSFTDDDSASEEVLDEIENQPQGDNQQEVEEQASPNRAVRQGSSIALQVVHSKLDYFDCASAATCIRSRCTGLYFDGSDWKRCAKKVFKIYRKGGPGSVRVGDTVGIYYPRHSRWLGCGNLFCRAGANCPGIPSSAHGFNSPSLWNRCHAEIFKIFARGRNIGSPIYPHDHIMLYNIGVKKWIGLENSRAEMRTCPGTTLPPLKNKYETCWGEVLELLERSNC